MASIYVIRTRADNEANPIRLSVRVIKTLLGHTARALLNGAPNPISVIVPCHRVVATNGALTGYAGGVDRKAALLELEQVDRFAALDLALATPV